MPFQTIVPERKEYTLIEIDKKYGVDPNTPTKITIKQARVNENSLRVRSFPAVERRSTQGDPSVTEIIHLDFYGIFAYDVYLTMVGCNITNDEGQPVFKFNGEPGKEYLNMTRRAFETAWGQLPDDVAAAIHEKVLDMNPHWSGVTDDLGE